MVDCGMLSYTDDGSVHVRMSAVVVGPVLVRYLHDSLAEKEEVQSMLRMAIREDDATHTSGCTTRN
jgi:hypothetical protein